MWTWFYTNKLTIPLAEHVYEAQLVRLPLFQFSR